MSLPGKSVLHPTRPHPGRGHEISREFLWGRYSGQNPGWDSLKTFLPYNSWNEPPVQRFPALFSGLDAPAKIPDETSPVQGRAFVYDECGMICEEKMRLLDAFKVATSALFTATSTLHLKAGTWIMHSADAALPD